MIRTINIMECALPSDINALSAMYPKRSTAEHEYFTVLVRSDLTPEEKHKAISHEMYHILQGHHTDMTRTVQEIEAETEAYIEKAEG